MKNYEADANAFAKKHGIKLTVVGEPEYKIHFIGDKQSRYVFKLRLRRGKNSYTFDFGQSIAMGAEEPTMYDVLACLTKYDPEDFENFCSNYGYDTDSLTALRTYKAVVKEYEAMERLFSDIMDELREIN